MKVNYSNVTKNEEVIAKYEELVPQRNVYKITYIDNKDNTITINVTLTGTVNLAAFEGNLKWDKSQLSFVSLSEVEDSKFEDITLNSDNASSDGVVYFSFAKTKNITASDQGVFELVLSYSGTVDDNIVLTIDDISDAGYETETCSVNGGHIVVGN